MGDALRLLTFRVKQWDGADLVERNQLNNELHKMRPEPKVVEPPSYMTNVNYAIEWCEAMLSWKDDSAHGIVAEAHADLEFDGYVGDRIYAPQLATKIIHAALGRLRISESAQ